MEKESFDLTYPTRPVPTAKNIRQFICYAKTLRLDFEKLDKYLAILQRANILSGEARNKALITHAATLGEEALALNSLANARIDPKQWLLSLVAAEQATEPIVKLLTKNGVNLSRQELAIATLDTLITLGADINALKIEGKTLFTWSIFSQHEPLFRFAAGRGAKIYPESLYDERCLDALGTFLGICPKEQTKSQLLEALTRLGFDYQSSRSTFLAYALHHQDHQFIEHLLSSNDLLFVECQAGKTTFELLFNHAQPKMRALLQEIPLDYATHPFAPVTKAIKAAKEAAFPNENITFLQALCQNVPLERFSTTEGLELVLHLFCLRSMPCILVLFERGYNVDRVQIAGLLLWQYFVQQKNGQAIAILLAEKKITIETKLQDGSSVLFWLLSQSSSWDPVEFLLAKGICLSGRGANNEMLLHFLVKNQDFAKFQAVLPANRANINLIDHAGKTALYYALESETEQRVAMVSALLQAGAHPFHLGDRMVRYVNHVRQSRYQDVVGKSALWKLFELTKERDFRDWFLSQDFRYQLSEIRYEALECAFLIPQFVVNPCALLLNTNDYLAGLVALWKKYPEAPFEYFLDLLVKVDVLHVKKVGSDPFPLALDGFRKEVLNRMCTNDPAKYRRFGFTLVLQFAEYYETRVLKRKNPALESAIVDFTLEYNAGAIFTFAASFLKSQLEKDKARFMEWFKDSSIPLFEDSGKISKQAVLWFLIKHNVLQERLPGLFSRFLKSTVEGTSR